MSTETDDRFVRLAFDASDPAYPGWVVSVGRVIDPDRTVIIERIGAFATDDFTDAQGLAERTVRIRALPLVEC